MRFLGWRERVALTVSDAMTEAGASLGHAALIGQAVLTQLHRDPAVPELFLVQRADSFGGRHDVIQRQPPDADGLQLCHLDIRVMGRAARQAIAAEFDAEDRSGHGTLI